MSMVIKLPDELARRIEAVAAARGENAEDVALEALGSSPMLAPESSAGAQPVRRRLALAGIGSTGGPGISTRIDELLADGFGRD